MKIRTQWTRPAVPVKRVYGRVVGSIRGVRKYSITKLSHLSKQAHLSHIWRAVCPIIQINTVFRPINCVYREKLCISAINSETHCI